MGSDKIHNNDDNVVVHVSIPDEDGKSVTNQYFEFVPTYNDIGNLTYYIHQVEAGEGGEFIPSKDKDGNKIPAQELSVTKPHPALTHLMALHKEHLQEKLRDEYINAQLQNGVSEEQYRNQLWLSKQRLIQGQSKHLDDLLEDIGVLDIKDSKTGQMVPALPLLLEDLDGANYKSQTFGNSDSYKALLAEIAKKPADKQADINSRLNDFIISMQMLQQRSNDLSTDYNLISDDLDKASGIQRMFGFMNTDKAYHPDAYHNAMAKIHVNDNILSDDIYQRLENATGPELFSVNRLYDRNNLQQKDQILEYFGDRTSATKDEVLEYVRLRYDLYAIKSMADETPPERGENQSDSEYKESLEKFIAQHEGVLANVSKAMQGKYQHLDENGNPTGKKIYFNPYEKDVGLIFESFKPPSIASKDYAEGIADLRARGVNPDGYTALRTLTNKDDLTAFLAGAFEHIDEAALMESTNDVSVRRGYNLTSSMPKNTDPYAVNESFLDRGLPLRRREHMSELFTELKSLDHDQLRARINAIPKQDVESLLGAIVNSDQSGLLKQNAADLKALGLEEGAARVQIINAYTDKVKALDPKSETVNEDITALREAKDNLLAQESYIRITNDFYEERLDHVVSRDRTGQAVLTNNDRLVFDKDGNTLWESGFNARYGGPDKDLLTDIFQRTNNFDDGITKMLGAEAAAVFLPRDGETWLPDVTYDEVIAHFDAIGATQARQKFEDELSKMDKVNVHNWYVVLDREKYRENRRHFLEGLKGDAVTAEQDNLPDDPKPEGGEDPDKLDPDANVTPIDEIAIEPLDPEDPIPPVKNAGMIIDLLRGWGSGKPGTDLIRAGSTDITKLDDLAKIGANGVEKSMPRPVQKIVKLLELSVNEAAESGERANAWKMARNLADKHNIPLDDFAKYAEAKAVNKPIVPPTPETQAKINEARANGHTAVTVDGKSSGVLVNPDGTTQKTEPNKTTGTDVKANTTGTDVKSVETSKKTVTGTVERAGEYVDDTAKLAGATDKVDPTKLRQAVTEIESLLSLQLVDTASYAAKIEAAEKAEKLASEFKLNLKDFQMAVTDGVTQFEYTKNGVTNGAAATKPNPATLDNANKTADALPNGAQKASNAADDAQKLLTNNGSPLTADQIRQIQAEEAARNRVPTPNGVEPGKQMVPAKTEQKFLPMLTELPTIEPPGKLATAFNNLAKPFKWLGKLGSKAGKYTGVGAALGAGFASAEMAYALKDEEFLKATGLASEEAFDAVKAIHVWNITQSAADVTMVGGEFATDAMIDHVTNQYGLDPLTAELIMPDLLITMMGDDIVKKEGYDQLKEMFNMEKYTEYSENIAKTYGFPTSIRAVVNGKEQNVPIGIALLDEDTAEQFLKTLQTGTRTEEDWRGNYKVEKEVPVYGENKKGFDYIMQMKEMVRMSMHMTREFEEKMASHVTNSRGRSTGITYGELLEQQQKRMDAGVEVHIGEHVFRHKQSELDALAKQTAAIAEKYGLPETLKVRYNNEYKDVPIGIALLDENLASRFLPSIQTGTNYDRQDRGNVSVTLESPRYDERKTGYDAILEKHTEFLKEINKAQNTARSRGGQMNRNKRRSEPEETQEQEEFVETEYMKELRENITGITQPNQDTNPYIGPLRPDAANDSQHTLAS